MTCANCSNLHDKLKGKELELIELRQRRWEDSVEMEEKIKRAFLGLENNNLASQTLNVSISAIDPTEQGGKSYRTSQSMNESKSRKPSPSNVNSYNKKVKIRCFSDSQGSQVASRTRSMSNHQVFDMLKPGAKFEKVTEDCKSICHDMSKRDLAVIIAGTNDVACNEADSLIQSCKRRIMDLQHTNALIFSIPHRHDLPRWSCVNKEIAKTNARLKQICKHFSHVYFSDLGSLGRRLHTSHGLHLSHPGKKYVADTILKIASGLSDTTTETPAQNLGSCPVTPDSPYYTTVSDSDADISNSRPAEEEIPVAVSTRIPFLENIQSKEKDFLHVST
ncbi:uncharacterized protein LOC120351362 isoform X1 [Nilaparvata lugens]|uniref:uncharacterized protein LOC120351362 isoform X1 n=1 Tax=Nilaparvata lugens TaxID=108931 RepID=UPI00193DDFBE|nr:uncharacterized protein LOC120351362 isoform X1 [Nilaparvata lugens]